MDICSVSEIVAGVDFLAENTREKAIFAELFIYELKMLKTFWHTKNNQYQFNRLNICGRSNLQNSS